MVFCVFLCVYVRVCGCKSLYMCVGRYVLLNHLFLRLKHEELINIYVTLTIHFYDFTFSG